VNHGTAGNLVGPDAHVLPLRVCAYPNPLRQRGIVFLRFGSVSANPSLTRRVVMIPFVFAPLISPSLEHRNFKKRLVGRAKFWNWRCGRCGETAFLRYSSQHAEHRAELGDAADRNPEAMLILTDITLRGTHRPRLDNITIHIPAGRTALVGYSGAGKTSLLNVLAGFAKPDHGSVRRERAGGETSDRLAMYWVPQNGGLWPHLTTEQHLSCVQKLANSSDEILAALHLEHRRSAFPAELSQGERSRLALARALASRARVLLLDEPLSHVDPVRKPGFWRAVQSLLDRDDISVVFSSHEPETVLRQAEHVICLKDGRVAFQGATRELYDSPPTQELGEFLGPLNWLDASDRKTLAGSFEAGSGAASKTGSFGVRPERLLLIRDATSPLELQSIPFCGAYRESVVKNLETGAVLTLMHQATTEIQKPGDRVRVVAG
jgi:iron(III) transport system ATP-binding protein